MKGMKVVALISLISVVGLSLLGQAQPVVLEVAAFEGGYGIEWLREIASHFENAHPGVRVEVWGSPRVWEVLRPRFIAGNPPDLCMPSWGFDIWSAIFAGQITPLNEFLNSPPYGATEGRWMDTFVEGLWEPLGFEGKYYIMPLFVNIHTWWYDAALWEREGWRIPNTWREFEQVAEKIKAAGYYPISTTGIYPVYPLRFVILPTVVRLGGMQVLEDAFNLTPGAWEHPAFIEAARIWQEAAKKYFAPGWEGADHIESQMLLVLNKAAIVPCGSWLPSEMAEVTPPGVKLRAMMTPSFERPEGVLAIPVESDESTNFVIPAQAKHPELAAEFLKFMTSPEMVRIIVEKTGALVALKEAHRGLLSEAVLSAIEVLDQAEATYDYTNTIYKWYPTLNRALEDATSELLLGRIRPEEWAQKAEAAAEAVRQNPAIRKFFLKLVGN